MKLLLDTHIFLWYISKDKQLPPDLIPIIRNSTNEVFLSSVSVWEIIVKHQLGKLPLRHPPETYIPQQRQRHQIMSLPLDEASVTQLAQLPALHKDPFDRMLISQAKQHNLTLITTDNIVQSYSPQVSLLP